MKDKPISKKPSPLFGQIMMLLFGGIFFAAGAAFLWFVALVPFIKSNSSGDWIETLCTITSSEVQESRSDGSSTYKPQVEFEYVFQEQIWVSESYDFTELNRSRSRCREIVADHPPGTQSRCFVDPNNPDQAVIVRGYDFSWLGSILPLVFVFMGLAIMFGSFFSDNSKSISGRINKSSDRSVTLGLTPRSPESTESLHPGDVEDQNWDLPQKLRPKQSRIGGFLLVLFAAVFWNGIVIFMACGVLRDFKGLNGFGWLPLLFGVPFAIVGLIIVAGAVRGFAALFNPTVELAFSTGAVGRGENVDIAWQLGGRVSRIRSLKIGIEAKETAIYRRGTDTITDEHVFHNIPIAELTDPQEIQFGSATIDIPVDTMHSFEADHNRIEWSVVLHGEIPFWADIQETFDFRVKP